jgi:DinB superfamily
MSSPDQMFAAAAIKAFRQNLDRATKLFTNLTEDQLQIRIAPGKNRLFYLWGHLIAVNDTIFPLLGIGDPLYPEFEAIFIKSPDGAAQELPTPAELAAASKAIDEKLLAAFNGFTASQWLERHTAVSEEDFAKEPGRNRFAILLSRTSHLAYHLGQAILAPK